MKAKGLDIFKFLIGWPLSLLALFFIIKLIIPQVSQVQSAITSLTLLPLVISIICFIGYYICRTYLWHEMMKKRGVTMPLKETMHLWSVSEINRYIPGNIWSLISRTVRFSEKKLSKKDIAASLFHETEVIMLGAIIVSLLSIPYLSTIPYIKPILQSIGSIIPLILVCSITILFIFQKSIIKKFSSTLSQKGMFLQETPKTNFRFLIIAVLSMLFFGMGYFFSITSIVHLPAHDFFIISGFAVASLIIGYLSFVTPTGLGIREGFLTLGLSPLVGVSLAGFAALFARVILIISEILFLLFTWMLFHTKHKIILKIESYVSSHKPEVLVLLGATIYTLYFSVASFLRYNNFYTGRFDLGNMVQTVWNTSQGRFFLFTQPDSTETVSRLAFHADFILLFFAPLYYIWPHPDLLLFFQTLIVASGAFFLYGISHHLLKQKTISVIIAFSYLLNPALERSNLYDFHAVVLATTFFLAVWYFFLKEKYGLMIIFLILAGITKEQVWAITGLFGILIIAKEVLRHKKEKVSIVLLFLSKRFQLGVSIAVISSILFYLLIWNAIPEARGGQHFAVQFYEDLGSNPSDIVKSLFLDPIQTFSVILYPERIDYLKQLLLPLGFLPLLFPFTLIFAMPDLIINLLSENSNFYQIYYQYTATITPFLFISMVYAVWWIHKAVAKIPLFAFCLFILFFSLYGSYMYGPLPGSRKPNLAMFDTPIQNREEIVTYLKTIPKSAKVAATNNVGSHLSERENITTIPIGEADADYIVFLIDPGAPSDQGSKEKIIRYMNSPNYILMKQLDNFSVFRKVNKKFMLH